MQSLFPEVCTNGNKLNLLERCGQRMVATGAFGLLRLRGPHLWSLDRVGFDPAGLRPARPLRLWSLGLSSPAVVSDLSFRE